MVTSDEEFRTHVSIGLSLTKRLSMKFDKREGDASLHIYEDQDDLTVPVKE